MTAEQIVVASCGVLGSLMFGVTCWSFVARSVRSLFAAAEG